VASGVFIIASLGAAAETRVAAIQREFDPKLAASSPPHLTIAGSSGVGPICAPITLAELRAALEPITSTTSPMVLPFDPPHHFMQTTIIVLPLDPHGPLRELHDRIAASGLPFERARFTFTPHATLSFHRTHDEETLRRLLELRVSEPAVVDRISVQLTDDPQPSRTLLELPLLGSGAARGERAPRESATRGGGRSSAPPSRRGGRG
jgi:2'-5' RNA ligase